MASKILPLTEEEVTALRAHAENPRIAAKDREEIVNAWLHGRLQDEAILIALIRNASLTSLQFLHLSVYFPVECWKSPQFALLLLEDPSFAQQFLRQILISPKSLLNAVVSGVSPAVEAFLEMLRTRTDLPEWLLSVLVQIPVDLDFGKHLSAVFAALVQNPAYPIQIRSSAMGDWMLAVAERSLTANGLARVEELRQHPLWGRLDAESARYIDPTVLFPMDRTDETTALVFIEHWIPELHSRWNITQWDFPPDADSARKLRMTRAMDQYREVNRMVRISETMRTWLNASFEVDCLRSALYASNFTSVIALLHARVFENPSARAIWEWMLACKMNTRYCPPLDAYRVAVGLSEKDEALRDFLGTVLLHQIIESEKALEYWNNGLNVQIVFQGEMPYFDLRQKVQAWDGMPEMKQVIQKELRGHLILQIWEAGASLYAISHTQIRVRFDLLPKRTALMRIFLQDKPGRIIEERQIQLDSLEQLISYARFLKERILPGLSEAEVVAIVRSGSPSPGS